MLDLRTTDPPADYSSEETALEETRNSQQSLLQTRSELQDSPLSLNRFISGGIGDSFVEQPFPQPKIGLERRDRPPSLDRLIFNNSGDNAVEQPLPQSQPQPLHNPVLPQPLPNRSDVSANTCHSCQRSFPKPYLLHRHEKSHTRPFKCPEVTCSSEGFQYSKDLDRHLQAKHPERVPEADRHHCPVENCKYSEQGGETFGRLDHLRRHIKSKHPQAR